MQKATKIFGLIFFTEKEEPKGTTELPRNFVATGPSKVLIAGDPTPDVQQLAFSEMGLGRFQVYRHPEGEATPGMLVNLLV